MPDPFDPAHFDPSAAHRWTERLARFAAGGQSVVAFCAAEGVSASNFYLWRRRLSPPTSPATVPPPVAPTVVPLRIAAAAPAPAAPIELALPSGTVVRFPADARPELVVAVLRGWEGRPC